MTAASAGTVPADRPGEPGDFERRALADVLHSSGTEVVELISRGGDGGWQLLIAEPEGLRRWTVVVAADANSTEVLAEATAVTVLRARVDARTRATLPEPVCLVDVGRRTGMLFAALPGRPMTTDLGGPRCHLAAALAWLRDFWATSQGGSAQVGYLDRLGDGAFLEAVPPRARDTVERALRRLATQSTPRTAVHGSTSPATLRLDGSQVVGVDDWRRTAFAGEPMSDLVGFAVRYAPDLLPGVAADGRGGFAEMISGYLRAGLETLRADPELWLDLLVAGSAGALHEPQPVANGARAFLARLAA